MTCCVSSTRVTVPLGSIPVMRWLGSSSLYPTPLLVAHPAIPAMATMHAVPRIAERIPTERIAPSLFRPRPGREQTHCHRLPGAATTRGGSPRRRMHNRSVEPPSSYHGRSAASHTSRSEALGGLRGEQRQRSPYDVKDST